MMGFIDILRKTRTIVTHANCADGMASAIILHDAFPKCDDIIFLQYGTKQHEELPAQPGMLFCDMTPPRARVKEFVAQDSIVLDHHKSQRDIVEAFGVNGVYADEASKLSGASLAFDVWRALRHVPPFTTRESELVLSMGEFASVAAVRDTWQRDSLMWSHACEQQQALTFYPPEHWLSVHPFSEQWNEMMRIGAILVTRQKESVKKAIAKAWRAKSSRGKRLVIYAGSGHINSDVAEELDKDADLVACFNYFVDADGWHKLTVSLRSHTGFDCAALAKSFPGGGGHSAAAGFTIPFMYEDAYVAPNPYLHVFDLVNNYERRYDR